MSLLTWQDSYSVNVKELDDQHKKMFELINHFYESMKESSDKKYVEEALRELIAYGDYHLGTEEKYFEKYDFPAKEQHTNTHNNYRAKINEFASRNEEATLSFEIIDFLEDWWLGHIGSVDKEYTAFFNKNGLV